MNKLQPQTTLDFELSLRSALQDFPYSKFKIFPSPYDDKPENIVCANECTFNPRHLVTEFFGKSALPLQKNVWGWGVIEVEEVGEDSFVIGGIFDVSDKEDCTKGRIKDSRSAFRGEYNPATRQWSFQYGVDFCSF